MTIDVLEGLDILEFLDVLEGLDILEFLDVLEALDVLERLEKLEKLERLYCLFCQECISQFLEFRYVCCLHSRLYGYHRLHDSDILHLLQHAGHNLTCCRRP